MPTVLLASAAPEPHAILGMADSIDGAEAVVSVHTVLAALLAQSAVIIELEGFTCSRGRGRISPRPPAAGAPSKKAQRRSR